MRWRFGRFLLDRESACLWEGEQRLTLRPKTFELLWYLVEHADELVRTMVRSGVAFRDLEVRPTTLEEAFLHLTAPAALTGVPA